MDITLPLLLISLILSPTLFPKNTVKNDNKPPDNIPTHSCTSLMPKDCGNKEKPLSLTPPAKAVPEPTIFLGVSAAIGLGIVFKRIRGKK